MTAEDELLFFHRIVAAIERVGDRIVSAIQDLQAQEAATVAVETQAITGIQTLVQELAAAQAAGDDAQVEAVVAQLKTSSDALAAALPAATATPPSTPAAAS